VKLFVAIPSHSGSAVLECVESLLAAQKMLADRGDTLEFWWEGGAVISVVRNLIAAQFLASDADMLLMVDADQSFSAHMLARMIDLNQPVVGCIYPTRKYNWERANLGAAKNIEGVVYQASSFVGWLETDEHGEVTVIDGFARAAHVGTGILLIRREAFQVLIGKFPELQGRGFAPDPRLPADKAWGFFNMIDDGRGVPFSEDLSFCRRWRAAGGEIWAEITSLTTHVGRQRFTGNYFDYLQAIE
jgi:hypothetical protein